LARLEHAGGTPGRPEVDDDGLTAQRGQAHRRAQQIGVLEIGSRRVLRRLAALRLALGGIAARREPERGRDAEDERTAHWSAFSAAVIHSLMKEKRRLKTAKRSEISSTPTPTSTTPEVISSARKCRRMREKPSRNTSMLQPAIRNGTARPAE